MSYFGSYGRLLSDMIDNFDVKYTPQSYEIELDESKEDPLKTLVTSEQIWNDGNSFVHMNEFYALSIVGPQGSGKTSIAKQIATFAKENDFRIIYAMPEDYMNDITTWLELVTVTPRARTMIILDDLSYSSDAQNRKNQALLKNMISRVRHIFKGEIFMIYITHRLHATPPMLRNSGSWIFTNMQSADRDDALEIIGRNKEIRERLEQIYTFIARVSLEGAKNRVIKYHYNEKEYSFQWGDREDPGDGRMMAIYHGGVLKLFHSQVIETSINFEDYRFIPIPKVLKNGT